MTGSKVPAVQLRDINGKNIPATTSLAIAEFTGKEHRKVVRDIDDLIQSGKFSTASFGRSSYISDRGRTYNMYIVDELLTTVLLMGFTGDRAIDWKIAYCDEFMKMRTELNNTKVIRQKGDEFALADKMQKLVLDAKRKELENKEGHTGLYCQISRRTNELAFGRHEKDIRQDMNKQQAASLNKAFLDTVSTILEGTTNPTRIKEEVETKRRLSSGIEVKS